VNASHIAALESIIEISMLDIINISASIFTDQFLIATMFKYHEEIKWDRVTVLFVK